jgi:hypothetical protein
VDIAEATIAGRTPLVGGQLRQALDGACEDT